VRPTSPYVERPKDDTPWPLPLRLLGYTVLAISIPYTAATGVAESPKARDWLEGDRPDDPDDHRWGKWIVGTVRQYLGVKEPVAYPESLQGVTAPAAIMSFESELPRNSGSVRNAQAEIERLKHGPVKVRATIGSGDSGGICAEAEVDGTMPASSGTVKALLSKTGAIGLDDTSSAVAIDFTDAEEAETEEEVDLPWTENCPENDGGKVSESGLSAEIRKMTHSYSAWHYDPTWSIVSGFEGQASQSASNSTSDTVDFSQLRVQELESMLKQLKADLNDPTCTRDFDDIRREMNEVKGELWRLRGWGGKVRSVLPF